MPSPQVEKIATDDTRDAHHTVTENAVDDIAEVSRQGLSRKLTTSHPVESVAFGHGDRRISNTPNPM